MAGLPPIRRFLLEDFKSQQSWIGPLLLNLNTFVESTVNALNKSLTVSENTTGDLRTILLSAVPTAAAPASLSWTKSRLPTYVSVGNITLVGGAAFTLSNAVQVQWTTSASALHITNVTGITPSSTNQYQLTLLCLTG